MKEVDDIKKSYQFLEEAGLQDSTEAVIMAHASMDLSTRSIKAAVTADRTQVTDCAKGPWKL